LPKRQNDSSLVIISVILMTCELDKALTL